MTKTRLFLISLTLAASVQLVILYVKHRQEQSAYAPKLVPIADGVFLTSQLYLKGIPLLSDQQPIKTIIDFRPDGEASDQPSSREIEIRARRFGMNFHYIPVPHESIPDNAVDELTEALSHDATPAVLYCRTGRRAVRTFALAQASQVDGPAIDAIMKMVQAAGFSADDLKDNLAERIAHRTSPPAPKP